MIMRKIVLLLFIILPIFTFILGMNYQKVISNPKEVVTPTPTAGVACTLEAKICPDGSSVGRVPPDCEFAPCPITSQENNRKRTKSPTGYECPENNYVDCMPGPYELKWECTTEYLQWAQENCPGFKGAAY